MQACHGKAFEEGEGVTETWLQGKTSRVETFSRQYLQAKYAGSVAKNHKKAVLNEFVKLQWGKDCLRKRHISVEYDNSFAVCNSGV